MHQRAQVMRPDSSTVKFSVDSYRLQRVETELIRVAGRSNFFHLKDLDFLIKDKIVLSITLSNERAIFHAK